MLVTAKGFVEDDAQEDAWATLAPKNQSLTGPLPPLHAARMDVQVLPSSMKFPVLGSVASFLTRRSIVKVRALASGDFFVWELRQKRRVNFTSSV